MATKKRGLGNVGRDRFRRSWEDIENDEPVEPNWLTGQEYEDFEEGRIGSDVEYNQLMSVEDVLRLDDKPENYGFGPKFSTRVKRHLFVPDNPNDLNRLIPGLGTVYVHFHKYDDVEAYYSVPFNVYQDFARSTSKGRFINHTLNGYSHEDLNKDQSVFSQ